MADKKLKRQLTAEAVIFNQAGRVLLVKSSKKRRGWELPGGHVKKTESLVAAIVREVKEEAGLVVEAEQLIGVFFIQTRNTHDFVFRCRLMGINIEPTPGSPEILEASFFATDDLPSTISVFTASRIHDALEGNILPLPIEISKKQWMG